MRTHGISIIFADGLGFHYLDNEEVRKSMYETFPSVIPLQTVLGYSAGAIPSIWTSNFPAIHGYWNEWMLRSDYKPRIISINHSAWILTSLPLLGIKKIQQLLNGYSGVSVSTPMSLRRYFQNRKIDFRQPFMLREPRSVFSVFEDSGIELCYSLGKAESIAPLAGSADVDVFFLDEIDGLGHRYGPSSETVIRRILDILKITRKIVKRSKIAFLFSDHGMCPVKSTVDLMAELRKLRARYGKDYLAFFESTMVRFWFFSNWAKEEINTCLSKLRLGHFLDPLETKNLGLNFTGNMYGDMIYLVEPSLEIVPSFFNPALRNFHKGMHGYSIESKYSHAILAATCRLSQKKGTILDICPTILDMMNINPPEEWKGATLA